MRIPALIAVGAAALLTANVAMAKSPYVEAPDNAKVAPFNITVGKLEGMAIYDKAGNRIGDVDEALANTDGVVKAVSVDVGGFLGIGTREAVVRVDQLVLGKDKLILDMTKEQVATLENFAD